MVSLSHIRSSRLKLISCGTYQFNIPFIGVSSGSNGCVSVVSWDVKKSRPDLIEGDKAEKHHRAAMPLNTTQKQGRMDCSGKEREKKKVKGMRK